MPKKSTPIAQPIEHAGDDVRLFSLTEAAERLGISRTKLYDLIGTGQLGYRRLGKNGDRRIPHSELVRFASADLVIAK